MKNIVEAYPGISPGMLEEMTMDQVACLYFRLKGDNQMIRGTPEQLAAMGWIPQQPFKSYVRMVADGDIVIGSKRQRRRERLAKKRALREGSE